MYYQYKEDAIYIVMASNDTRQSQTHEFNVNEREDRVEPGLNAHMDCFNIMLI